MEFIIETINLTKRYGTATVVDKVNLHVPKGKIYGLLVTKINVSEENLEQYFSKLIGGGGIA